MSLGLLVGGLTVLLVFVIGTILTLAGSDRRSRSPFMPDE